MTDATTYRWEDDYADLPVDDSTYADFDWDEVPADIVNRHDTLLSLDADALAATSLDADDPIALWAAARRWLALDRTDRFESAVRTLLATEKSNPSRWLSYPDIRLEFGRTLAATDLDAARVVFDEYEAATGHSPTEAARYRGLADIAYGDKERGAAALVAAVRAHAAAEPELASTLAEALFDLDETDVAHKVLETGIEVAEAQDDPGLARELRDLIRLTSG